MSPRIESPSVRRLVFGSAGILLLVSTLMSLLIVNGRQRGEREALERRARAVARTIEAVLEATVDSGRVDRDVLEAMARRMPALDQLLWIEIFDQNMTIIAHSIPSKVGSVPSDAGARTAREVLVGANPVLHWDEDSGRLEYFLPVRGTAETSPKYVVGLALTTDHIRAGMLDDILQLFALILVATVITVLSIGALSRRLVKAESTLASIESDAATLGRIVEDSLHEVYLIDASTLQFRYVNAGARRNLGRDLPTLQGMTVHELQSTQRESFEKEVLRPLRDGLAQRIQYASHHIRQDGSRYPVNVNVGLAKRGDGPVLVALVLDQTETRRAEEELRMAQKMELIGQFSAGIAHDFNNLLTTIQGSVEVMRLDGVENIEEEDLVQIENAVRHAGVLTRKLLAFGRRQGNDPLPLDLRAEVQALLPLLRRLIPESIEIRLAFCEATPVVHLDSGNLEQIVINLVANARDAMRGGGVLEIEIAVDMTERGRIARLTVLDDGEGIPEDALEQIFEPFFTTKEPERGTGLGLFTVRGIVEEAGGTIAIGNREGSGVRVDVRLPLISAPVRTRTHEPAAPAPTGGTERIVVCEDEAPVLETMVKILGAAGYEVLPANGLPMALEHLRERGPCDLLVTDLVMPSGSGYALAQQARTLDPGLPVLFVSGYDPTTEIAESAYSQHFVVPKPFTAATLLNRVRALLDQRARRQEGGLEAEGSA